MKVGLSAQADFYFCFLLSVARGEKSSLLDTPSLLSYPLHCHRRSSTDAMAKGRQPTPLAM